MDAAATKFVSSLVKSLQILCNGHLEFCDGLELVGHINIRIDKKLKFNCILDELVSKRKHDSTTFVSNSYHSLPPSKRSTEAPVDAYQDSDFMLDFASASSDHGFGQAKVPENFLSSRESKAPGGEQGPDFSVSVTKPSEKADSSPAVKVEENEICQDNPAAESSEVIMLEDAATGKGTIPGKDGDTGMDSQDGSFQAIGMTTHEDVPNLAPEEFKTEDETPPTVSNPSEALSDMKQLISKLTDICDVVMVQNFGKRTKGTLTLKQMPDEDLISAKKRILQNINKSQIKKLKDVLQARKGPQRKQELKTLISEIGLTNDQLCLLAYDAPNVPTKSIWKDAPYSSSKKNMMKEHQKSYRRRTQERQERLLEMAEMLKRNNLNDPGITVLSNTGAKKCTLFKSSMSIISHNTQQFSMDNFDEAVDLLTNTTKKGSFGQKRTDNPKDMKTEVHKRHVVKRKMKQIVSKMLDEIIESGYRVVLSTTVGSEVGSQTAELRILPLNVAEIFPENRDPDMKSEMTEEEYAKHLEREQFIEKQKNSERKMKEMEGKLTRILSGADEIYIPSRRRYAPGEIRPTDAERMKEYRKKLKADPEKYQMYKQKRSLNKKRRRLSALAAKLKDTGSTSPVLGPKAVSEEPSHAPPPLSSLVAISQPSVGPGAVEMHCPQVYGHQQAGVSVHHSGQFVSQVSGIHTNHQQPISYDNQMDIVELIAATHNVQNQHFG